VDKNHAIATWKCLDLLFGLWQSHQQSRHLHTLENPCFWGSLAYLCLVCHGDIDRFVWRRFHAISLEMPWSVRPVKWRRWGMVLWTG
jgi:hypothetical protein